MIPAGLPARAGSPNPHRLFEANQPVPAGHPPPGHLVSRPFPSHCRRRPGAVKATPAGRAYRPALTAPGAAAALRAFCYWKDREKTGGRLSPEWVSLPGKDRPAWTGKPDTAGGASVGRPHSHKESRGAYPNPEYERFRVFRVPPSK